MHAPRNLGPQGLHHNCASCFWCHFYGNAQIWLIGSAAACTIYENSSLFDLSGDMTFFDPPSDN